MDQDTKDRKGRIEALIQTIVDARKLLLRVHMRCPDGVSRIICRGGTSKTATDLPAQVTCSQCQAILRLPLR